MSKRKTIGWDSSASGVARGLALFFGAFSAVNSVASILGALGQDAWWIDLAPMIGRRAGLLVLILSAALLVAYAVAPRMGRVRRLATLAACGVIVVGALANAVSFWRALGDTVTTPLPVPLSAFVAVVFVMIGVVVVRSQGDRGSRVGWAVVIASALAMAVAFPLAQVCFFGNTDYRRPAQGAVILGAKVHDSGMLSSSLRDRVETGIELYDAGLAPVLVMSGGLEPNGIDEAVAMRRYAIARGVPADRILMDHEGVDSDSTVRNTVGLLGEPKDTRLLVVSQFYHLPRLKMAYSAAGQIVYTVPAGARQPIGQTPRFVAREVPAWWVYWARGIWRGVRA